MQTGEEHFQHLTDIAVARHKQRLQLLQRHKMRIRGLKLGRRRARLVQKKLVERPADFRNPNTKAAGPADTVDVSLSRSHFFQVRLTTLVAVSIDVGDVLACYRQRTPIGLKSRPANVEQAGHQSVPLVPDWPCPSCRTSASAMPRLTRPASCVDSSRSIMS